MKRIAIIASVVAVTAMVLSAVWQIAYIFTLLGFSAWAFIGHVVTADDDVPGGWSNPNDDVPFPWVNLGMKAAVLVTLALLAYYVPWIRALGGGS